MAEKVLLTGISGFLGGHVALELLKLGYTVRGSVRTPAKAESVRRALREAGADLSQLEICILDLLHDDGWAEAARGCDYLQHIASPFVLKMPKHRDALIRPAVEGARRALSNAMDAGVKRMVVTSSLAAIDGGHRHYGRTLGPSDWTIINGPMVNAYAESKTLAEREAWKLAKARGRGCDLVSINPGAILGPLLDDDPGTSGLVIQRLLRGEVPMAPDMRLAYVHVRDVAAAHVAAMRADIGGQRVLLGNPVCSIRDLSDALRGGFPERGAKLPRRDLPSWAARLLGLFDRSLGDSRAYLGVERRYDSTSGEALLGRPFIGAGEAAIDMGRSMIARGLA